MIHLTESGLRKIDVYTPDDVWPVQYNANWDILQSFNSIGGLTVVPRDYDLETFRPSSRYFTVTPGYFQYNNMLVRSLGFTDQLAPASGSISVWLDARGNLNATPGLPVGQIHIPLGFITSDANVITAIVDYRCYQKAIGGPLSVSRVGVTADYTHNPQYNFIRADATNGPIVITLLDPALMRGQLFYVRKADATANLVTITGPGTIEGAVNYALPDTRTVALAAHPTDPSYEVVF